MATAPQLTEAVADLEIRRVQPTIGAEITGIDLSQKLSPAQVAAIRVAVIEHKVVFFRDQSLDNDQHKAFAAEFGPLYTHPSARRDDNVAVVHAIAAKDDYATRYQKDVLPGDAYHTDTSWRLVPTWGVVLRDIDLPPVGGDTLWVDANLAYEGLSDEIKQRLEGKFVTHNFQDELRGVGHEYPLVAHPVVRTHRETGRKILWVNYSQKPQILGVELAESRELLAEILRQYKRPEFQARFAWRPGTVAFWDNRATVHYAVKNYCDYPRKLHRILIADEPLHADL